MTRLHPPNCNNKHKGPPLQRRRLWRDRPSGSESHKEGGSESEIQAKKCAQRSLFLQNPWFVCLFVAVADINCLLMRSHSQPWWSGHCAFFASPTPEIHWNPSNSVMIFSLLHCTLNDSVLQECSSIINRMSLDMCLCVFLIKTSTVYPLWQFVSWGSFRVVRS